jgi:hypothetical protein
MSTALRADLGRRPCRAKDGFVGSARRLRAGIGGMKHDSEIGVDIRDIGAATAFLCSPFAKLITGGTMAATISARMKLEAELSRASVPGAHSPPLPSGVLAGRTLKLCWVSRAWAARQARFRVCNRCDRQRVQYSCGAL